MFPPEVDAQAVLAAIVASSDDAILSKDPNGIITSWNAGAERLYGWTAQEAIGQPITLVIPRERHGEERVILDQIMAGKRVSHYETQRQGKDGRLVEVSLTVSPIHAPGGGVAGASVIARDITGRKREEDLERELEKRDFIARAAHELKNPLTTIAGMAQILRDKEDVLGPSEKANVYGALIRQSDRANRLIGDLLELARIESGQVEIELLTVDLAGIVDGSEDAASEEAVEISNGVPPGTMVSADPFRLEEVFVNLFTNSAKYGASAIRVEATVGSDVRVTVVDDGPGIPPDLAPQLFEAFTRGAHPGVAGSGLGLSIAKRLCRAMGGDLDHEPTGTGATFVLTLTPARPDRSVLTG